MACGILNEEEQVWWRIKRSHEMLKHCFSQASSKHAWNCGTVKEDATRCSSLFHALTILCEKNSAWYVSKLWAFSTSCYAPVVNGYHRGWTVERPFLTDPSIARRWRRGHRPAVCGMMNTNLKTMACSGQSALFVPCLFLWSVYGHFPRSTYFKTKCMPMCVLHFINGDVLLY